MKFLLIFIDMLRPNLLNVYDNKNRENRIDKQLKMWGGTVYTNSYTPAPDTPRSNGCLWTSRYPKDNGCDNRLKYPYFFKKEDCVDLLTLLKKEGYQFNIYAHEATGKIGEFPISVSEIDNYSGDVKLEEYLKTLTIEKDSFTYFCLEDFHKVVTNCYAQKKYIDLGYEKIGGALELIQRYLDIDTFDLTIMFSDHGFKFRDEPYWNDYNYQLNNDRIQIFMMTHRKNEREIKYNNKLATIMDIYPTICNCAQIDIQYEIEGIDLFERKEYSSFFVEDHKTFNAELGQTIEFWAVVNKKGRACVNCDKSWVADYEMTEEEKKEYEDILTNKASCFAENTKMRTIQRYYDECLNSYAQYYDGELRTIKKPLDERFRGCILQGIKKLKRLKHKR